MIVWNNDLSPRKFYRISYLLYRPNKFRYLKLSWPVIFLGCCQMYGEKKNELDSRLLWPLSFWHLFFYLPHMKQNGTEAEFYRRVQGYPKFAGRVMMYHHRPSGNASWRLKKLAFSAWNGSGNFVFKAKALRCRPVKRAFLKYNVFNNCKSSANWA